MNWTGIKDIDLNILQKLSDIELSNVCKTSNYFRNLCKTETFWFNRIYLHLKINHSDIHKLKKYLNFNDYKSLYLFLTTKNYEDILIYLQQTFIDDMIKRNLNPSLPKWINRDEFIYEIRRRFTVYQYNSSKPDTATIVLINNLLAETKFIVPGGFNRQYNKPLIKF